MVYRYTNPKSSLSWWWWNSAHLYHENLTVRTIVCGTQNGYFQLWACKYFWLRNWELKLFTIKLFDLSHHTYQLETHKTRSISSNWRSIHNQRLCVPWRRSPIHPPPANVHQQVLSSPTIYFLSLYVGLKWIIMWSTVLDYCPLL